MQTLLKEKGRGELVYLLAKLGFDHTEIAIYGDFKNEERVTELLEMHLASNVNLTPPLVIVDEERKYQACLNQFFSLLSIPRDGHGQLGLLRITFRDVLGTYLELDRAMPQRHDPKARHRDEDLVRSYILETRQEELPKNTSKLQEKVKEILKLETAS